MILLAGTFLEENRPRLGLRSLRLAPDAHAVLLGYDWPGNVRELEHLIGRAALKAMAGHAERPRILSLHAADLHLPSASVGTPPAEAEQAPAPLVNGDLRQALEQYQRQLISACLSRHQGSYAAAARELGLDRANLNRLAKRLQLR